MLTGGRPTAARSSCSSTAGSGSAAATSTATTRRWSTPRCAGPARARAGPRRRRRARRARGAAPPGRAAGRPSSSSTPAWCGWPARTRRSPALNGHAYGDPRVQVGHRGRLRLAARARRGARTTWWSPTCPTRASPPSTKLYSQEFYGLARARPGGRRPARGARGPVARAGACLDGGPTMRPSSAHGPRGRGSGHRGADRRLRRTGPRLGLRPRRRRADRGCASPRPAPADAHPGVGRGARAASGRGRDCRRRRWCIRGTPGERRRRVPVAATRRSLAGRGWVGSASMEHEVFVPVPAEPLRQALADPARVARCGSRAPAGRRRAGPLAGRLKVRVGGHTITYRGALRITGRDDGLRRRGRGAPRPAAPARSSSP